MFQLLPAFAGANGIASDLVKGRLMLNLDTEDWGEIFIGCAGGGDTSIQLDVQLQPAPAAMVPMQLKVSGLLGGHSGLNINEDRGNAVIMMAQTLAALQAAVPGVKITSMAGGDKRNAIPREAWVDVLVPAGQEAAAQAAVAQRQQLLATEFGKLESDLSVALSASSGSGSSSSSSSRCIADADVERVLALLALLPHGPLKYSHAVPGLVETSSNLASIQPAGAVTGGKQQYVVVTSTRSSLMHALESEWQCTA
jgi:dipeptidase D